MTSNPAIEFFNTEAEALFRQYTAIDRRRVHAGLLKLLPEGRALKVLDIGAGAGADAALFSGLGHQVWAAEPADKLRDIAIKSFDNINIKWNADVLPEMKEVSRDGQCFDVIIALGVLQYLDKENRHKSLEKIFSLAADRGLVSLQYPVPPSRAYQHSIDQKEIYDFARQYDEGARLDILMDKSIADFAGRKTAAGEDIYFRSFIFRYVKT